MEDRRKIKDLYNCKYIVSDKELYPLQKWYNELIDKSISEITIADVLRMIRQKEFIDLAVAKAMIFLRENVFTGEAYDGELLERISEMDLSFLTFHSDELKSILKDAMNKIETHDWLYEGEREEFRKVLTCTLEKIT